MVRSPRNRLATVAMITSQLLGDFRSDPRTRSEFLNIIGRSTHLS